MRRRALLTGAAALPVGLAAAVALHRRQLWQGAGGLGQRDNILMIVVDDLNGWLGCLAERPPRAITPAIDQLAARGTLFRRAYCAAPYCNASRMAVFSGRWPSSTGVYRDEDFWERTGRPATYLERLRAAGYHMLGAGKVLHGRYDYAGAAGRDRALWLDLENRDHLWDAFVDSAPQPLPLQRPLNGIRRYVPGGEPTGPQLDWGVLPAAAEGRHPDAITADAVRRWLMEPPAEPFFCAAGFYSPHLPWYAPQRCFDAYPPDDIVLPAVKDDDLDDVPALARQWAQQLPDHATITAHGQWREAVRAYLAAVTFVDGQIARVLEALAASPARERTTVVLWSDNGFHLGEKLHWRKFTLWEEATRVPLLVVPSARRRSALAVVPEVSEPVSVIDVFPTLFELEGLPQPPADGRSLLPLMGGAEDGRQQRAALMSWGEGNHSIREGAWRYSRYRDGGEELYHQPSDPLEWRNRSGEEGLRGIQRQLRARMGQLVAAAPGG